MFDLMPQAFGAGERFIHAAPWLQRLLQRWDAANSWWTDNVVKFEYSTQMDLLARLGIRTPDARYLGWAFMAALLGWLAIVGWHMGRTARAPAADALARAYLRLCRKLARAGACAPAAPGPGGFRAQHRPHAPGAGRPGARRCSSATRGCATGRPGPRRRSEVADFSRAVARLSLRRAASA